MTQEGCRSLTYEEICCSCRSTVLTTSFNSLFKSTTALPMCKSKGRSVNSVSHVHLFFLVQLFCLVHLIQLVSFVCLVCLSCLSCLSCPSFPYCSSALRTFCTPFLSWDPLPVEPKALDWSPRLQKVRQEAKEEIPFSF